MQGVKNRIHIRENLPGAVFANQKLPQFPIVRLGHFVSQKVSPVIMKNLH
jgi:hypothetical protein